MTVCRSPYGTRGWHAYRSERYAARERPGNALRGMFPARRHPTAKRGKSPRRSSPHSPHAEDRLRAAKRYDADLFRSASAVRMPARRPEQADNMLKIYYSSFLLFQIVDPYIEPAVIGRPPGIPHRDARQNRPQREIELYTNIKLYCNNSHNYILREKIGDLNFDHPDISKEEMLRPSAK